MGKYLFALIAMCSVSQASSGRETFADIFVLLSSLDWTGVGEVECMIGVMVIFIAQKAFKTQGEIIAGVAHHVRDNLGYNQ